MSIDLRRRLNFVVAFFLVMLMIYNYFASMGYVYGNPYLNHAMMYGYSFLNFYVHIMI